MCSANLSDKIAIAVDAQMDDGVSNTGNARAVLQTAPNPDVATATVAASSYSETGTNTYTVCRTM